MKPSGLTYTVYPKKYAHGFCFAVLCCGYTLTDFPMSIRLTSLALWQSNDCPSANKATLMKMDKYFMWIHYERLHNHNKAKHNKAVCIFLGIYCIIIVIFQVDLGCFYVCRNISFPLPQCGKHAELPKISNISQYWDQLSIIIDLSCRHRMQLQLTQVFRRELSLTIWNSFTLWWRVMTIST